MKALILALTFMIQSLSASVPAQADFLNLDDQAKLDFIEKHAQEIYGLEEITQFMATQKELALKVKQQGQSLARVWLDTILEGPYAQTGDSKVEVSSLYVLNGEVLAVRAYVQADAILLDSYDCEFDYDQDQWIGDCPAGSIGESFYLDSTGELIESGEYAEFSD